MRCSSKHVDHERPERHLLLRCALSTFPDQIWREVTDVERHLLGRGVAAIRCVFGHCLTTVPPVTVVTYVTYVTDVTSLHKISPRRNRRRVGVCAQGLVISDQAPPFERASNRTPVQGPPTSRDEGRRASGEPHARRHIADESASDSERCRWAGRGDGGVGTSTVRPLLAVGCRMAPDVSSPAGRTAQAPKSESAG